MIDTHLHILPTVDDGPETIAFGCPGVGLALECAGKLLDKTRLYQLTEAWPAAIVKNQLWRNEMNPSEGFA